MLVAAWLVVTVVTEVTVDAEGSRGLVLETVHEYKCMSSAEQQTEAAHSHDSDASPASAGAAAALSHTYLTVHWGVSSCWVSG